MIICRKDNNFFLIMKYYCPAFIFLMPKYLIAKPTVSVGIMEYKVCKKFLFLFKHSKITVQIIKNDSLLFVLYNNSLILHNQSTKVMS